MIISALQIFPLLEEPPFPSLSMGRIVVCVDLFYAVRVFFTFVRFFGRLMETRRFVVQILKTRE